MCPLYVHVCVFHSVSCYCCNIGEGSGDVPVCENVRRRN